MRILEQCTEIVHDELIIVSVVEILPSFLRGSFLKNLNHLTYPLFYVRFCNKKIFIGV